MIGLIDESEIYDAKIRRTEVKKLKESDKVKRIYRLWNMKNVTKVWY